MTAVTALVPRLFVAWQDPDSRRFHPVALLDRSGERYRFRYLKQAEGLTGFEPFVSFPNLHQTFESEQLFPLFENRLMSTRRPDYPRFLEDLGLEPGAHPFDVLSRSGRRFTDSVDLFADPAIETDTGELTAWFFVRGIRHVQGAEAALEELRSGAELRIVPERDNEVSDQAILVSAANQRRIGWVPDYLVSAIHRLWSGSGSQSVRVIAERLNPPTTPLRARVLCRLQATAPAGFQPFDDPQFMPLVDAG